MAWLLLLAISGVGANPPLSIPVRIYAKAHVDASLVRDGRAIAAQVLLNAGVRPLWINCSAGQRRDARCGRPLTSGEAVVRVEAARPAQASACGQAFWSPFEGQSIVVTLYTPCISRTASGYGAPQALVFGYVLAHEIGHVLLGPAHHASGVMQARWTRQTITDAVRGLLAFTRPERAEMRDRLSRAAR